MDGVVFGPLVFGTAKLSMDAKRIPSEGPVAEAYDPNPAVYKRLGVEPPQAPEDKLPERRALLEKTMLAAKDRGMEVYVMYADSGAGPGGDGYYMHDEKTMRARVARMVDTLEHFPMADGAVMDGPEWGYEMAPHHMNQRSYFFKDLPEAVAPMAADLGYDYRALVAAKDSLLELLHNLDPGRVRLHARGGLVGAYQLLGADPDLMAWLSFRVETLTSYFRRVREGIAAELDRSVRLGCGPRSAAFAPLCGYDFAQLAQFMDFLLPKHYFFHRGFDGFVGTVFRYCETLCEWNPGLTVADALEVVQALFGIVLPGVEEMGDFESALSPRVLRAGGHPRNQAGTGGGRRSRAHRAVARHGPFPPRRRPHVGARSENAPRHGGGGGVAALQLSPPGQPERGRVGGDQRQVRQEVGPAHQRLSADGCPRALGANPRDQSRVVHGPKDLTTYALVAGIAPGLAQ